MTRRSTRRHTTASGLRATPAARGSTDPGPQDLAPAQRGQIGHQLALRAVPAEADDHDPAGLDAGDHALAERGVRDVLTQAVDDRLGSAARLPTRTVIR